MFEYVVMSLPFHQISKETKGQRKIFQLAGASQLRFGTMGKKKILAGTELASSSYILLVQTTASSLVAAVVASLGWRGGRRG